MEDFLNLDNDQLTELPEFPESLMELWCNGNNITIDGELIKNLSKFSEVKIFIINDYRVYFTKNTIEFMNGDHSFEVEKIF